MDIFVCIILGVCFKRTYTPEDNLADDNFPNGGEKIKLLSLNIIVQYPVPFYFLSSRWGRERESLLLYFNCLHDVTSMLVFCVFSLRCPSLVYSV